MAGGEVAGGAVAGGAVTAAPAGGEAGVPDDMPGVVEWLAAAGRLEEVEEGGGDGVVDVGGGPAVAVAETTDQAPSRPCPVASPAFLSPLNR